MTYQISQRVEFLTHERGFASPPSNLAVEKVKEETKRHEAQGQVEVAVVIGIAETIAQTAEDGIDAAEAWSGQKKVLEMDGA